MANELKTEKKAQAVSLLCEGSTIRAIERVIGIHRDAVMRLGAVYFAQAMVKYDDGIKRVHVEAPEPEMVG